jgi:hypothetical protein
MEADVERALEALLARHEPCEYATVRALAAPPAPVVPEIAIPTPDLGVYDALLTGGRR